MPTAKQASPSGGTALPAAAPHMCAGIWGWRLHGGELFWFSTKEMASSSSHPAAQHHEVARWDVQGDGHRVRNLTPVFHPRDWAAERCILHLPLLIPQQWGMSQKDGGFTLWTKPSRNQSTLSLPAAKNHQPSTGTPPAQTGGLDGEGTSSPCLEGLSPAGDCSSRFEDECSNC